jgi:putative component of membrane protein insertase Oxa1/YidC/SpoIIIJ protein YidD
MFVWHFNPVNDCKNHMRCARKHAIPFFMALLCLAACSHSPQSGGDAADPGAGLIAFYRGPLNHLAAVRGGQCPMYPSCSEYSRLCLEKYGPVVGWIMAIDRLMRCGRDETRLSPSIVVDGEAKTYDPVANNAPNPADPD